MIIIVLIGLLLFFLLRNNNESFSIHSKTKLIPSLRVWGWAINKNKSKMEKMAELFLGSARHYGVHPKLIGIGWKYAKWEDPIVNKDGSKAGKGLQRFYVLREALKDSSLIPDNSILLIMDAGDTVICGNEQQILKKFQKSGTDLLFSAEKNFTYQRMEYKDKYDTYNTKSPYKYMAAGTFIGYAGVIREMVNYCISKCCEEPNNKMTYFTVEMNVMSDWVWNNLNKKGKFTKTKTKKVDLDSNCNLFWVTSSDAPNFIHSLDSKSNKMYNSQTKTYPLILHMVGGPTRDRIKDVYNKIIS